MAARKIRGTKTNPWSDDVRHRIKSGMLINRLRDHVVGKVEMSPTQLRAAEILLRKSLPDLQSIDHTTGGEPVTHIITGVPRAYDAVADASSHALPAPADDEAKLLN